jgi:hypothetical protein
MLYGWAAREAERRGFAKIVTYTRADEARRRVAAGGKSTRPRLAQPRARTVEPERLDRQDAMEPGAPTVKRTSQAGGACSS